MRDFRNNSRTLRHWTRDLNRVKTRCVPCGHCELTLSPPWVHRTQDRTTNQVIRWSNAWTAAVQYKFLSRVTVRVMKMRYWAYLDNQKILPARDTTIRSLLCSLWSLMHDVRAVQDLMSRKSMIDERSWQSITGMIWVAHDYLYRRSRGS